MAKHNRLEEVGKTNNVRMIILPPKELDERRRLGIHWRELQFFDEGQWHTVRYERPADLRLRLPIYQEHRYMRRSIAASITIAVVGFLWVKFSSTKKRQRYMLEKRGNRRTNYA